MAAPAKKTKKFKTVYEVSGGLKRKNKNCPKCGMGIFMAHHKDRWTSGKCRYTEFERK
jgi:small subunit ribosomal protein S27Ae